METSGKLIAELARDLGINDNNLYRWRGMYGSQAQANTHGNVAEMEAELKRLRREVEVLQALELMTRGQDGTIWIKAAALRERVARLIGQPHPA